MLRSVTPTSLLVEHRQFLERWITSIYILLFIISLYFLCCPHVCPRSPPSLSLSLTVPLTFPKGLVQGVRYPQRKHSGCLYTVCPSTVVWVRFICSERLHCIEVCLLPSIVGESHSLLEESRSPRGTPSSSGNLGGPERTPVLSQNCRKSRRNWVECRGSTHERTREPRLCVFCGSVQLVLLTSSLRTTFRTIPIVWGWSPGDWWRGRTQKDQRNDFPGKRMSVEGRDGWGSGSSLRQRRVQKFCCGGSSPFSVVLP